MLIAVVFGLGVPLGLEGGVIGGLAFAVGIATEMVVNVLTSRRAAGWIREDPPDETGREVMGVDEAHDDLRVGPISEAK